VVAVSDDAARAPAGAFVAPGRDVPTTQPGGRWYLVNGSSYAAAHVSGLFALMREHSAKAEGPLALVTLRPGGGAIDTCATLTRASGPCACACSRPPQYSAIVRQ
jgi:subtilisin family serine protease